MSGCVVDREPDRRGLAYGGYNLQPSWSVRLFLERGSDVATEIEPSMALSNRIEAPDARPDREERRVAALERLFRGVLQDEDRIGDEALRGIDRAVRGDLDDD